MDGIEFKELFKVAVETLREKTITPLLEADATYQEDSDNEGIAEMHYLQLDLTEEQRRVCNRLLECRDKQDIEYATHAYIAGLYDAFRIMAVLFPDKWDTCLLYTSTSALTNGASPLRTSVFPPLCARKNGSAIITACPVPRCSACNTWCRFAPPGFCAACR